MTKLTDTQLIVLSSGAQHDEGLATRPANLNVAAAVKVASSLVAKGLAREIRAKADAPVWHENDDDRFALKITKAGREAIGVDEDEQQAASPSASVDAPKPKKSRSKSAGKKDAAKAPAAGKKAARQKTAGDVDPSSVQIRAGSKQATIVKLMAGRRGPLLTR